MHPPSSRLDGVCQFNGFGCGLGVLSVHWRVRCARYVGLIMVAVCLACPPMPPVSRAMKHSRCVALLLDEPTLRAGRSAVVSNRRWRWRGKRSRLAAHRHMQEASAQLFATRPTITCRPTSIHHHQQQHPLQTQQQPCLPSAHPATVSRRQRASTTSKTPYSSSPTR